MKFVERLEIRWALFSAWLLLVLTGSVVVSWHGINTPGYRKLLFKTSRGVYWPWPGASRLHYVARTTLPANHYLVDSDLERPDTPWSVQIDPPGKDVLEHFLRHAVSKAEPVDVDDVSANPYFGDDVPAEKSALVLLPSSGDATKLKIGQEVAVFSPEPKVQARGRVVAIGSGQALISVPERCAALIAARKNLVLLTSSPELKLECPNK